MTAPAQSEPTNVDLARRWGVSDRTIKTYKAKGAPLWDDAAMLEWCAGLHDLPKAMQRRVNELRAAARSTAKPKAPGAAGSVTADPEWAEFEKSTRGKSGGARSESEHLEELKRQRAFALFKLKRAQETDDPVGVAEASHLLKLIAPIVHDEELRGLKLNRELGESVPVVEQDRTARALVYWLMRGADEFVAVAAKRIADSMQGGAALSPEDIRQILEPLTLAKRVLEPFAKAAQSPTGVSLSPRIVASMRAASADFLERGDAAFDAIYADAKTEHA